MVLFSIPLSIVDREIRQKTIQCIQDLTNSAKEFDLIYNDAPNTGKTITLLKHNETLNDIKHMLAHNTSHKIFFRIDIIQSIISNYDGIKL